MSNEDPRLRKALDAWAQWYSRKLDAAGSYSGSEQDLFEALGCEVPDIEACAHCNGTGLGAVDMMRLGHGDIDENGNMRWPCAACNGRRTAHDPCDPVDGFYGERSTDYDQREREALLEVAAAAYDVLDIRRLSSDQVMMDRHRLRQAMRALETAQKRSDGHE